MRVTVLQEPAYVLHSKPYRETSRLVEALTPNHGRVGLLYRGARRRRTDLKLFADYAISWSGAGQLYNLRDAEELGRHRLDDPDVKVCGLYANELILKLVQRGTSGADLFGAYRQVLSGLAEDAGIELLLRRFELRLLEIVGYGLQLENEAESSRPIQPSRHYRYDNERGPVHADAASPGAVSGRTLLGLRTRNLHDKRVLGEAKHLLRDVIDFHLQGQKLISRDIMRLLTRSSHQVLG